MPQFLEFLTNHWGLSLAFAALSAMLVWNEFARRFRGFKEISPTEVTQLVNHEDAVLLDIRDSGEVRDGRIPNALHIPLGELQDRTKELEKFKSRPVVVYCRSGQRSARACSILQRQGFEALYNLGGGIMNWQNANLPISKK